MPGLLKLGDVAFVREISGDYDEIQLLGNEIFPDSFQLDLGNVFPEMKVRQVGYFHRS